MGVTYRIEIDDDYLVFKENDHELLEVPGDEAYIVILKAMLNGDIQSRLID
jgi:hypothetical protein